MRVFVLFLCVYDLCVCVISHLIAVFGKKYTRVYLYTMYVYMYIYTHIYTHIHIISHLNAVFWRKKHFHMHLHTAEILSKAFSGAPEEGQSHFWRVVPIRLGCCLIAVCLAQGVL